MLAIINVKFCPTRITEIQRRIDNSIDTSIVGMPGVGISTFLIEISAMPLGHMIFIDAHTLTKPTTQELCAALLQKLGGDAQNMTPHQVVNAIINKLGVLAKKHRSIVISIGGFDQLRANFDHDLFHTLITFKGVSPRKIVFLFGVCRRLESLVSEKMIDTDMRFLSSVYYLKPYEQADLLFLLPKYGSIADLTNAELSKFVKLSGGHFQFLRLLLNVERENSAVNDPFIKLTFRNIYTTLNTKQKAIVRQLAQNGVGNKHDDFLFGVGLIVKQGPNYKLFSTLFADCVRTYTMLRLPAKEQKLFSLLRQNIGHIVSKQQIFNTVWNKHEIASEWALNALIYRLRKHPAFLAKDYTIENQKKLGYTMIKND